MEPWQGPEPRRPPSARVPAGIEEYFPLDTVCDTVPANVDARVSDLAGLGCFSPLHQEARQSGCWGVGAERCRWLAWVRLGDRGRLVL